MRWQTDRESDNVEDRRSVGGPLVVGGGITTVALVLLVWFLGGDPRALLQQMGQEQAAVAPGEI